MTRRVVYLASALGITAAAGAGWLYRYGLPGSVIGGGSRAASYVVTAPHFFHDELAAEVARAGAWKTCPLIAVQGDVTADSGKRADSVMVYGVDQRLWGMNGLADPGLKEGEAFLSPTLAKELPEARSLLVRIPRTATVSPDWVFAPGPKPEVASTTVSRGALDRDHLGEFSIRGEKGGRRAVFIPFGVLQKAIGQEQGANTILITTDRRGSELKTIAQAVRERVTPIDLGLQIRQLDGSEVSIESDAGLISEPLQAAIDRACSHLNVSPRPVLSGLAKNIQARGKSIPHSFVAAVDEGLLPVPPDKIVLTDWAGRELAARPGDPVTVEIYVRQSGYVATKTFTLALERVIPMNGIAIDANLAPEYPGITESASVRSWTSPFPLDLGLIRPQDEDYWTQFRTAPKAFVSLATGQQLWGAPSGNATSVRVNLKSGVIDSDIAIEGLLLALQAETDPMALGYSVQELPRRHLWP